MLAGATEPARPEIFLTLPAPGVYNGPIVNGVGEAMLSNGDVYVGDWKNGKPDGIGKMTYMLGGSYEGEWQNGRRHGKGIMHFAGGMRSAEVRFENGRRVDVREERPSEATADARFWLLSDDEPVGSHIRNKVVYGPLPLDRGFDALTADQQRLVRSSYPALDVGDTPPYPLNGGKDMYRLLESLVRRTEVIESILVYVALDADAKVTTVTTLTHIDEEYKRLIAAAAGLVKYSPARCGGRPCPGVVSYNVKLGLNYGRMLPSP
jgi:hypothetical protein